MLSAMTPKPAEPWALARTAYPGLPDDREAFFAFAAERPAVHIADLYLVWACSRSDPAALAAFERDIVPAITRALTSFNDRQEIVQMLREQMLVRTGDRLGIEAYDGRAPLAVWLRVCATRIGLREHAKARRPIWSEPIEQRLDELAPGVSDPQLAYLRRLYGASFQQAFDAAVAGLAPRDRNLLKLSVIDGLGIDQLAKIFHVHRSTAARRLELVRTALVSATRDRMRRSLAISESELDSVMRVLTHVTLHHALARKSE